MTDPANPSPSSPGSTGVIGQIRDKLNTVLGGTNPNQFFTMTVPGTILDPSDYAYDLTKGKPEVVASNESRLVDQLYDISSVSPAPNGQRLSTQFLQALSVLIPRFDPLMPKMKNTLRAYLHSPAPDNATVDGTPFSGNLEEFYFALYEAWLAEKSKWEREVIHNRHALSPELFLEWYEGVAETRLAIVDAAEGRLLAVFSPTDMNAILGALAAGPGGAMQVAAQQVMDLRLPSPDGGFVYPVNLTPDNWFLDLASDLDPVDLLKDPAFIALTLTARRQSLSASIAQIQNLITQMPSTSDLAAASTAFSTAQSAYNTAQSSLQTAYTANTITAANMVMKAEADSTGAGELDAGVAAVSKAAKDTGAGVDNRASKSNGDPLSAQDVAELKAGMQAVSAAQTALLTGAQGLANAGLTLASDQASSFGEAPVLLARMQQQLADITTLQNQLAMAPVPRPQSPLDQTTTDAGLTAATSTPGIVDSAGTTGFELVQTLSGTTNMPAGVPLAAYTALAAATADGVSKAAAVLYSQAAGLVDLSGTLSATAGTTTATLSDAVLKAIDALTDESLKTALQPIAAAAQWPPKASSSPSPKKPALQDGVADGSADDPAHGSADDPAHGSADDAGGTVPDTDTTRAALNQAIKGAGENVIRQTDSWVEASIEAVTAVQKLTALPDSLKTDDSALLALFQPTSIAKDDVATYIDSAITTTLSDTTTRQHVGEAANARASAYVKDDKTGAGTATPAATSDRWLSLQFSSTVDEVTSDQNHSASSSQTSWSVDLFFGSASGSSSTSTASSSADYFAKDTTIQIGMKATKVEIERGWFDPGVFKLSRDMSRISSVPVSEGPIPDLDITEAVKAANAAILPSFPVAFVVVKDVTLQFQCDESQMDNAQSVFDSRSAVGGGFLCFSASSSSAAHSDASSLHTKSTDTVVRISMPGPQILGWFHEFTPEDQSGILGEPAPEGSAAAQMDIIDFVTQLKTLAGTIDPLPVPGVESASESAFSAATS